MSFYKLLSNKSHYERHIKACQSLNTNERYKRTPDYQVSISIPLIFAHFCLLETIQYKTNYIVIHFVYIKTNLMPSLKRSNIPLLDYYRLT